MLALKRASAGLRFPRAIFKARWNGTISTARIVKTDSLGIPLRPTWSVNELLSSYPNPRISSATLTRLHELSALVSPEEGTREHAKLKEELEELVRLVEAVKSVDTKGVVYEHWGPELGDGAEPDTETQTSGEEKDGIYLLEHASRTHQGLYVVEADRQR